MISKKLFVPAVALVIGGIVLSGSSYVSAQSTSNDYPPIIDRLVAKFNLNPDEVKAVFDEEQEARQSEMKAKIETKLTQAVTDGKITEAQKQAILTKLAEEKAEREANKDALKDKTHEERHALMEAKRTEMETWAKEQGIEMSVLKELIQPFGGKGMRMRLH